MYFNSLRAATGSSGGKGLRIVLGQLGGTRGGGALAAAPAGSVIPSRGRRSFSVTPPAPGAQAVGMDLPKQQQQQDAVHGDEKNARDGNQKGHWCPMTHSFGEGYATRADEEGFGVVYAKGDDDGDHPGHPEYDTSQGSEVKEKEKARHHKDDKHAT